MSLYRRHSCRKIVFVVLLAQFYRSIHILYEKFGWLATNFCLETQTQKLFTRFDVKILPKR